MISRHILFPLLATGAIGLPLLIFNRPGGPADSAPLAGLSNSAAQSAAAPDPFSPLFGTQPPTSPILPGGAAGPNFLARPMEFQPISNLSEIIRFDIYPNWVKNRWDRVSTCPDDYGLHGLRVALVTGVNPWDLHGSLTYYFDANQHLQRISFRGWTGDASQLVALLSKEFKFKEQATHWAGCYLAYRRNSLTGALFMQHPTVIDAHNPNQQVAILLEINHPQGSFVASDEIQGLVSVAGQTR